MSHILNKCHLFSDLVDYFGHIIKAVRLEVDQLHAKYLPDSKSCTNRHSLRSLIGLTLVSFQ